MTNYINYNDHLVEPKKRPISLSPRNYDDGLSHYMRSIQRAPMLEVSDEYSLINAWQEKGDRSALERLLLSHLRLVVKTAQGYRNYGLPLGDLISEGTIGLMQAINKFESQKGYRLSTYAIWWIRASIKEYVLRTWSMVRLGRSSGQRRLFFGLRSLKKELEDGGARSWDDALIQEIADKFNVTPAEVVEMNQRLASPDFSLNATVGVEEEVEWQDLLEDEHDNQEAIVIEQDELKKRRMLLAEGLKSLTPREYEILQSRHLSENPRTLAEIADDYGLSRERVRQIEGRALEKLQHAVQKKAVGQRVSV